MGVIESIRKWFAGDDLRSNLPLDNAQAWIDAGLLAPSATGVYVTADNAMTNSAVFTCVRVLSESVASLPWHVYRRKTGGKERATEHPLYRVLHDVANPEMTSFELVEMMVGHVLTWGNGFCEIEMNNRGDVRGLWPLRPDRMEVTRDKQTSELLYLYRQPNEKITEIPPSRILHLRGILRNGMLGMSVIAAARPAIGLAMATEEFGSKFFNNGARPGVILTHPGKLSEPARKNLKDSWEKAHAGLSNAQRTAILEEGITVSQIGIPPDDAQFLQTRKFQIEEIARVFRVPLHMVGDLEHATFSNIEHQSLEFVVRSLMPWLMRFEKGVYRQLLSVQEQATYFTEFLVDGQLRGDISSRYQAYAIGRQWGWLSADDVREMENMNELPDRQGKVYLSPMNMEPADQVGEEPAPQPQAETPPAPEAQPDDEPAQDQQKAGRGLMIIVADAAKRITDRCEDRNERKHREWFMDVMRPVVRALTLDDYQAEQRTIRLVRFWFDNPDADADALAKRVVMVCA